MWKKDFGDFKWNKKSFFHSYPSPLNPPTVQSDDLSGQIALFISQVVGQISHLLGLAQTACRDFLNEADKFLVVQEVIHLRINSAAGNGVDLDMAGGQLLGQSFGEGVDAALGSGVCYLAGSAADSPDRGNVYDLSLLLFHHHGHGQPAAVEYRGEIGVHNQVPVLWLHILEKSDVGDSRIVDKHVQPAELLFDFLE